MRWFAALLSLTLTACLEPRTVGEGTDCSGESTGACDPATQQLLQCSGGRFVVYSDCKGEGGCMTDGQTVSCDSSGNGAGDRCAAAGKYRCEPDGGAQILRCDEGVLTVQDTCPAPMICAYYDGGLGCL